MGGSQAEDTDATFPSPSGREGATPGHPPGPRSAGEPLPAPRLFFGCGRRGERGGTVGVPEAAEETSLPLHRAGDGHGDGNGKKRELAGAARGLKAGGRGQWVPAGAGVKEQQLQREQDPQGGGEGSPSAAV